MSQTVTIEWEQILDGRKKGRVRINLSGICNDKDALAFYFQKLVSRTCSRYLRNRIKQQIDNKGHHWLIETFCERVLCIFNSSSGNDRLFDSHDLTELAKDMERSFGVSIAYLYHLELIGRNIMINSENDGFFEVSFHEKANLDYLDLNLQKVLMEVLENEMRHL
ncbi:hypothetical protein K9M47_00050 [Candidatus Gracilibacteria bacterium]|nr:hypothetical protein [Candidatus Gracilibacteria bacterium]MCF7898368.1 hypothetical protein [Candidatus Paceibacterota bacterium]